MGAAKEHPMLTDDDTSEFTLPVLPPRSILYNLEPVGLGAPEVESLTGYIARLSEAHCVTVSIIFQSLLAPLLHGSHVFIQRAGGVMRSALTLNGCGISAEVAIRALETLTSRMDLRFLTLLPWAKSLSHFNLVKRNRVWCPACYEEWRTTSRIIYEPLIWTFKAVEVCTRHRIRLRSECQHCGGGQPWFANHSRPGYCSICKSWLGYEGGGAESEGDEWQYQAWVVESIGTILSASPTLKSPGTKQNGIGSISGGVESFGKGNVKAFADFIGVNAVSVRSWLGGAQPQLSTILQICNKTNLPLIDYLTGKVDLQKLIAETRLPTSTKSREGWSKNRKMRVDWRTVEGHLNSLLRRKKKLPSVNEIARELKIPDESLYCHFPDLCRLITVRRREQCFLSQEKALKAALKTTPPQSLKEVSKHMGFMSASHLWRKHPALCKAISLRYDSYRRAQITKRRKQVLGSIRNAAVMLHKQGVYPSLAKVVMQLPFAVSTWDQGNNIVDAP